jgi:hypothetical protein
MSIFTSQYPVVMCKILAFSPLLTDTVSKPSDEEAGVPGQRILPTFMGCSPRFE